MRSALLARPSKLSIRWPGATSTRQRVTPCVPVCAPVERVAQLVGVHTGKEGRVWLTVPSRSKRSKWGKAPPAANRFIIGTIKPSMPKA